MSNWRHQAVIISQELPKVRITKAELIEHNTRLTREAITLRTMLEQGNSREREASHQISDLRQSLNMCMNRSLHLARDLECYSGLTVKLNSELLATRVELERTRYELRQLQGNPGLASAVESEQLQPHKALQVVERGKRD